MKIVTYHGPEELKNEYLRVTEVSDPIHVIGQDIVGYYPDADIVTPRMEKVRLMYSIRDRILSRFPFNK